MRTYGIGALATGVCMVALALPAQVQAQERAYNIPAGSLLSALDAFGRQSGKPIIYKVDEVQGVRSRGFRGTATPNAALDAILAGMNFRVRIDGSGAIAIVKSGGGGGTSNSTAMLQEDQDGDAASGAAGDFGGDIIVTASAETATKTDTAITDIPQSISVISADLIAARGAVGLQEALRYTPGLKTETSGADTRFDAMSLRGFTSTDLLDGMRQPDQTARIEPYNLERIEVLRGPSSMLYGQAGPGGVVNSITKLPAFDFGGQVAVQYGSFDRKQAQVDITGPINAAGTLAARFVGVIRDSDNQIDFGKDDRIFVAPSLRFNSSDGRTDLSLAGAYQRERSASINSFLPVAATLLAPSEERELPRGTYLGEPSHNWYHADYYSATLQAAHEFNDWLTYSGRARYADAITDIGSVDLNIWYGLQNPFIDADNRVLPRYIYDKYTEIDIVTTDHHVLLDFTTGPLTHKLLFGLDYLRANTKGTMVYEDAGPIDIYDPVFDPASVPDGSVWADPAGRNTQLGVYLQNQIDYANAATVVVGIRRDRATTWSEGNDKQVAKATSLRFGLVLKPTATLSPYVSYSESFMPITGLDFYGDPFEPQRGRQWEGGVRWQPDRNTLVSAAYFDIKGSNRLVLDPDNGANQIQVGTVLSRGFEFEVVRSLPGDYTITASYSHVDAKTGYDTDPIQVGLPISGVPEDSASIWGDKRFDLGGDISLRVGAGVRHVGATNAAAVFYDVDPAGATEYLETPSFTLVDALLGLESGNWALNINATNLFDKSYFAQCSPRSACSYGYERNVLGTLSYTF